MEEGDKQLQEQATVELNNKELVFAETYLLCLNKAEAARQAGCPKKSAREQGYMIYNRPHVKAYIQQKLTERVLSAEETVKLVSDIAVSSLTDYYRPVKVVKTDKVEMKLDEVIKQRQDEVERHYIFIERKGLTEEERDYYIERWVMPIEDQILTMQIELERNPKAFRIVDSESRVVEEMRLDIALLVADKEKGRVKKIKYGKDGLEVEMYSADAAQDKLMKMHGKYEKDNEQSKPTSQVTIFQLPDNGR